jgi:catechol 2,3-dioxygenase-like lactoylglutathione lyase family enzyme
MLTRILRLFVLIMAVAPVIATRAPAQNVSPSDGASGSGNVPLVGIANVTFKVSNLAKARSYYQGVLGLPEAFDIKDASGKVTSAYFKINDDQYIEITPTLKPGELIREARVVFQSSNLEKLHQIYSDRGLNPGNIEKGPDGNPVFRVVDPEGNNLDFLQYVAGSEQSRARGTFLSPSRLSSHISHVGIMMKDRAVGRPFYEKLGFENARTIPGDSGEFVELPSSDRNLETKDPPLDPNNPATHDQYVREVYGAVYHVGLEVPDIRVVRDLLQRRGHYSDVRVRAAMGNNRHWLIHVFDPDGSRAEFADSALHRDVAPGTIMAPGPSGALIPPPAKTGEASGPGSTASASVGAQQGSAMQESARMQEPARAQQSGGMRPSAGAQRARSPRYVEPDPINFDDHTGWVQMFDGVDLKGWDGPMDLWHVSNGNIVVQSKADPPTGSTYLFWQGGEPQDFELKLEVKLEGEGANSGVQFRATLLGEVPGKPMSKWENRGYQADMDNQNQNTGALIECCAGPHRGVPPRPDRAYRGQIVRMGLTTGAKPTLLATFGDPDELKTVWKAGDWNQIHLIARGRTMIYSINGQLMSVMIDDNPKMFVDHGLLAIQLEGRGANKASFRNLWIKNLQ